MQTHICTHTNVYIPYIYTIDIDINIDIDIPSISYAVLDNHD